MIDCVYISEKDSRIKEEGWYILINDKPYFPQVAAEKLHMRPKEYIQILKSCNAKKIVNKGIEHYVFSAREDAESAIVTFKLIGEK
jgi:hypothetical protein